jgi:hypothetical protein
MRKRPIAIPTMIAILAGCQGLLAGSPARASDDDKPWEVHIAQIDPQASEADTRGRTPVSQPEAMHLDPRIATMARMADRLAKSTVVQRGNGNTAVSNTRGTNNITGQFQTGSRNYSGIGIDGFSNKVVTFQNGDKAYSSIDVIGGNKTIYDMQFGTTQRVKELPFTGTDKAKYLIIDKGQYGAYIARLK